MSWAIQLVIALAIFASGAASGIKYHAGQDAIAAQAVEQARQSDAIQQRKFGDKAATSHAQALAKINNQLGDARAKIALLSSRECLDADTVGLLSAIGTEPGGTIASKPASSSETLATGGGIRFATERDVAESIAVCRSSYAEVSSQLNQILDIEDQRHSPVKR